MSSIILDIPAIHLQNVYWHEKKAGVRIKIKQPTFVFIYSAHKRLTYISKQLANTSYLQNRGDD